MLIVSCPVDPKPVIDDAKRSIQIEGLPSLEIGYFLSETTMAARWNNRWTIYLKKTSF